MSEVTFIRPKCDMRGAGESGGTRLNNRIKIA
jgi:hypothetical protein